MERIEMKLWKWVVLIVLGPVLLMFVVGLFESAYGFDVPMRIASIVYAVGAFVVVGCYLLYEKWYNRWSDNPEMPASIITPELSGHNLITGGAFGAEASVISVVLGFLISCYMIYSIRQQEKQR